MSFGVDHFTNTTGYTKVKGLIESDIIIHEAMLGRSASGNYRFFDISYLGSWRLMATDHTTYQITWST